MITRDEWDREIYPRIQEKQRLFIAAFREKCKTISLEANHSWSANGSENLKLYHYTNIYGALGIINSQTLWATHYGFLNDPEERSYGFRLLDNFLDQHKSIDLCRYLKMTTGISHFAKTARCRIMTYI